MGKARERNTRSHSEPQPERKQKCKEDFQGAIVFGLILATPDIGALPEAAVQTTRPWRFGHALQSEHAHKTTGLINTVDAEHGRVNVAHATIPCLKQSRMTMVFYVADKAMLEGSPPGMRVELPLGKEEDRQLRHHIDPPSEIAREKNPTRNRIAASTEP